MSSELIVFGAIVIIVVTVAALRHKERIAMIKQGKNPYPLVAYPKTGRSALFIGLVAVAVGLALLISAFIITEEDAVQPMRMVSLICMFGGGASLIFWKLTAKDREEARSLYKKHLEKENMSHEAGAVGKAAENTEQAVNIGEN